MLNIDNHIFTGMQADFSPSKQPNTFYVDAKNIRLTADGDSTLMSIVNENSDDTVNVDCSQLKYPTKYFETIGSCMVSKYLVLFGKSKANDNDDFVDRIICIDVDFMTAKDMFYNPSFQNLNFSLGNPIEAIGVYENEAAIKVYWVDGLNQPRLINLMHETYTWNKAFDFNPELAFEETVDIDRIPDSSGIFPSGVIQYVFTYFNKYGQETSPFYVSQLHYITFENRGAAPDEVVPVSFKINVSGVDTHFEYIRIYSVLRTSINATPLCRKVADIGTAPYDVSVVDNYRIGETVAPADILMLIKPTFIAGTLEIKNNTMFFGNITLAKKSLTAIPGLKETIQDYSNTLSTKSKAVGLKKVMSGDYSYGMCFNSDAAGFKNHEYYRLGLQAQYKNGEWSEPVFIGDYQVESPDTAFPSNNGDVLNKLVVSYRLSAQAANLMASNGYKKVRPVIAEVSSADRTIYCQGVANPTMYTNNDRTTDKIIYAQSSWFYRPKLYSQLNHSSINSVSEHFNSEWFSQQCNTPYSGASGTSIPSINHLPTWNPRAIKLVEVQGSFNEDSKFNIDWHTLTLDSPDIAEDIYFQENFVNTNARIIGRAGFTHTDSSMYISTSSSTISPLGSGSLDPNYSNDESLGLVAGLFYEDVVADDYNGLVQAYSDMASSPKWMVYPWQAGGSLNNDIARAARSSVLQKKVLSNFRYANTSWLYPINIDVTSDDDVKVFRSDNLALCRTSKGNYMGNIDTLLKPENSDGKYFAFYDYRFIGYTYPSVPVGTPVLYKTWSFKDTQPWGEGIFGFVNNMWTNIDNNIGDANQNLCVTKEAIRMKYKSSPHVVFSSIFDCGSLVSNNANICTLPVIELYKDYNPETAFGGNTEESLRNNTWIPAGKAISVDFIGDYTELIFEYGDTFYSRYDNVKTYPFTTEDTNQIVEIGSFLLESHINVDGRYDKNRGLAQASTFNKNNFNLINKVYSQADNFFTYKILPEDSYLIQHYPNMVSWSLSHTPGNIVDSYASITLNASMYINSKQPAIHALKLWKDKLLCFMEHSVTQILYDERVQIQASDDVPIEIASSKQVGGSRELCTGIGCVNKFAIATSDYGVYFIDSSTSHLIKIADSVTDLSEANNCVTLSKNISSGFSSNLDYNTRLMYNSKRKELHVLIDDGKYLCFNEKFNQFISWVDSNLYSGFYQYGDFVIGVPMSLFSEERILSLNLIHRGRVLQDFSLTFVSNKDFVRDKIFTNIEFRGDLWQISLNHNLPPFTHIRSWNEYQDTDTRLIEQSKDRPAIIKKKFRIWRINMPRNNHSRDRIRNTWTYITLSCNGLPNTGVQIHDVNVYYYL